MAEQKLVLVTGASGFVGKWTVIELLRAGYKVRGTVRDLAKSPGIHGTIERLVPGLPAGSLEIVKADLLDDAGWAEALAGVSAVMHVATQILPEEPEDQDLVIKPALDGTQRVLRAAADAGIKRVIMTSSVATVGYGHGHKTGVRTYTEKDFTNLDAMEYKWAYCIGKTKAEQFAWEFARRNGIALTTIHPGMIFGPAADEDTSISLGLISKLLNGQIPAVFGNGFAVSDVRDVAALHVAALQKPQAEGERYLATGTYLPFKRVAEILAEAYPEYKVSIQVIPDQVAFEMVKTRPTITQIVNDIGNEKHYNGSKAEGLLGRKFVSEQEAVLSAARSLIELGIVKPPVSQPDGTA